MQSCGRPNYDKKSRNKKIMWSKTQFWWGMQYFLVDAVINSSIELLDNEWINNQFLHTIVTADGINLFFLDMLPKIN